MGFVVDNKNFLITGKSRAEIRGAPTGKPLDRIIFRLALCLAALAFLAVYSTGFLRGMLLALMPPIVYLFWRGQGLKPGIFDPLAGIASVVALGSALYQRSGPAPGVVLLIEFTSVILLLQLFKLRTLRDVNGAMILSLMIVLAVAAMNVNFIFPLVLMPYILNLFLVLRWISGFRHRGVASANVSVWPGMGSLRRQLAGFLVSLALFVFVWLALFYFIPRTESLGLASEASKRRLQGFSDTLSLSEIGLLEDNPAVVMRVKPVEERTMSPSIIRRLGARYLRGTTFSAYKSGRWEKGRTRRWFTDLRRNMGNLPLVDKKSPQRDTHVLEIILENTEPPLVFVPDQATELALGLPFIGVEDDRTLYFINRVSGSRRYLASVVLNPLEVRDSAVAAIPVNRSTREFLSTAGISDRLAQLAQVLASGTENIAVRVEKAIAFLQRQCVYSLSQADFGTTDPVEFFIFESKEGSCEHFATALALLLRAMQVPARPVSGYSMGDWNDVGKFFTVRQGHAHTWVEVYFPDSGWVPFDPTPVAEDGGGGSEISRFLLSLWETYEGYWFSYVYSFDNRSQVLGFRRIITTMGDNLRGLIQNFFRVEYALLCLVVAVAFRRRLRLFACGVVRSSNWIPQWYSEWEIELPVSRNPAETPAEFHERLLRDGVIGSESRAALAAVVRLIDEAAFKAGADQVFCRDRGRELLKKIKPRKGVH